MARLLLVLAGLLTAVFADHAAAQPAACINKADEWPLAGAARRSFLEKCERDLEGQGKSAPVSSICRGLSQNDCLEAQDECSWIGEAYRNGEIYRKAYCMRKPQPVIEMNAGAPLVPPPSIATIPDKSLRRCNSDKEFFDGTRCVLKTPPQLVHQGTSVCTQFSASRSECVDVPGCSWVQPDRGAPAECRGQPLVDAAVKPGPPCHLQSELVCENLRHCEWQPQLGDANSALRREARCAPSDAEKQRLGSYCKSMPTLRKCLLTGTCAWQEPSGCSRSDVPTGVTWPRTHLAIFLFEVLPPSLHGLVILIIYVIYALSTITVIGLIAELIFRIKPEWKPIARDIVLGFLSRKETSRIEPSFAATPPILSRKTQIATAARPRDTPSALRALRLAWSFIEEVQSATLGDAESEKRARTNLALAAKQLEIAFEADPDAVLSINDAEITLGQAELRARTLNLQAILAETTALSIRFAEQAAAADPTYPPAFYTLGRYHYDERHKKEAIAAFTAALALDPENIDYQKALIRAEAITAAEIATYKATKAATKTAEVGIKTWKFLKVITWLGVMTLIFTPFYFIASKIQEDDIARGQSGTHPLFGAIVLLVVFIALGYVLRGWRRIKDWYAGL